MCVCNQLYCPAIYRPEWTMTAAGGGFYIYVRILSPSDGPSQSHAKPAVMVGAPFLLLPNSFLGTGPTVPYVPPGSWALGLGADAHLALAPKVPFDWVHTCVYRCNIMLSHAQRAASILGQCTSIWPHPLQRPHCASGRISSEISTS